MFCEETAQLKALFEESQRIPNGAFERSNTAGFLKWKSAWWNEMLRNTTFSGTQLSDFVRHYREINV